MSGNTSRWYLVWVLPALLLFACGAPGAEPEVVLSMRQALRAEVTEVEIAAFDGSHACPELSQQTGVWEMLGLCTGGDESALPPCKLSRARLKVADFDASAPVDLYVSAGRRTIVGLGFDAGGAVVGFGCSGPHTIEAGGRTLVEITLE
ncbi:MAG: hypothetical protein D6729_03455 [Deltaproteobacteria bacterium]|nr:MAG: hypothetical protein D6729_03455 [Deltaproteobacteria bacterium]